jgi:branched-chain amino acid transport system permease protein
MLGGYVAVVAMRTFGVPFLLALPFAFLVAGLVSVVLERSFFRRV